MPINARIYRPAKNAMQSGRGNVRAWILEFEPIAPVINDELMGWSGSRDTRKQVRLRFDTRESALSYARRNGFIATVENPEERIIKPKSYADNFAFGKVS